eukprot:scaffold9558_cov112-Isochrysis_galbana.AAC.1
MELGHGVSPASQILPVDGADSLHPRQEGLPALLGRKVGNAGAIGVLNRDLQEGAVSLCEGSRPVRGRCGDAEMARGLAGDPNTGWRAIQIR